MHIEEKAEQLARECANDILAYYEKHCGIDPAWEIQLWVSIKEKVKKWLVKRFKDLEYFGPRC